MPDTYSVISATESLRERNVFKFKVIITLFFSLLEAASSLSP